MMSSELDKFLESHENRRLFEQERLILEITEAICALMNEQGVTRAQLAGRLDCTASNVSQMLDGENNFTVRTVADCLLALSARLTVAAVPLGVPERSRVVEEQSSSYRWQPNARYSQQPVTAGNPATPSYQLAA